MEQIIPIVIAVVVFAFQAYANYKKEQEKARQRQQAKPPVPPGSDEVDYREASFPETFDPADTFFPADPFDPPPPTTPRPSTPTVASTTRKPETRPTPAASSNPYGEYQGMIGAEEARRLIDHTSPGKSKSSPDHKSVIPTVNLDKKLEITELDDDDLDTTTTGGTSDHGSKIAREGLDLREAVIHSIILERPYA